MNIYFYCSYEHSREGFFLTEFNGSQLVAYDYDSLPEIVENFFSYDRFYFIWKDIPISPVSPFNLTEYAGSFCGIRDIKGYTADGRQGTINIVFLANADEIKTLRRTILTILSDFEQFGNDLFSMITTGGETSYKLDCVAFNKWLETCAGFTKLNIIDKRFKAVAFLPYLQQNTPARYQTELLHFAVSSDEWKYIYPYMGSSLLWRIKPNCVLSKDEFNQTFISQGKVWSMN